MYFCIVFQNPAGKEVLPFNFVNVIFLLCASFTPHPLYNCHCTSKKYILSILCIYSKLKTLAFLCMSSKYIIK